MNPYLKLTLKYLKYIYMALVMLFALMALSIIGFNWMLALYFVIFMIGGAFLFAGFAVQVPQNLSLGFLVLPFCGFLILVALPRANDGFASIMMTAEECAPIYEQHNQEVFDMKAEGLQGQGYITINLENCEATIDYTFLINAKLPIVESAASVPYMGYFAEHETSTDRTNWSGRGQIFAAYKNTGKLITPGSQDHSSFYGASNSMTPATHFYHHYSSTFVLTQDRYDNLFNRNKYFIIDGHAYIEETVEGENMRSYSLNTDKAAPVAPIVKSYDLKIQVR